MLRAELHAELHAELLQELHKLKKLSVFVFFNSLIGLLLGLMILIIPITELYDEECIDWLISTLVIGVCLLMLQVVKIAYIVGCHSCRPKHVKDTKKILRSTNRELRDLFESTDQRPQRPARATARTKSPARK
jgi:hypothetical protein